MKNFVFISPNYPANYWQFCRALKEQGFRVLGIGDAPRDSLDQQLLEQLSDYQQVSAIDCFEEMQAAVARYVDAYGPVDWLESNNEYWLGQDARLRSAFHLESGFQQEDLPTIRSKSLMKPIYQQAGIPVARYHVVDDFKHCAAFAAEVGYPVVVKPDNGHGITDACKLKNDAELEAFLKRWDPATPYLMEEFVRGEVNAYDAIIDENGDFHRAARGREHHLRRGGNAGCRRGDLAKHSGCVWPSGGVLRVPVALLAPRCAVSDL